MKEFIKKNFAIILAFVLPVALIVVIALSSYLPSLFLSTDYNFVYASFSDNNYSYRCSNYLQSRYSVVNGKLVINSIDPVQDTDRDGVPDINENYTVRFFIHDTANNESREITSEEVQSLNLSGLLTSPDGVTVSSDYDRGGDFFPFFDGNSSYGYYLTKGRSRTKLNLINTDKNGYYYQGNFRFMGWIIPGRN